MNDGFKDPQPDPVISALRPNWQIDKITRVQAPETIHLR